MLAVLSAILPITLGGRLSLQRRLGLGLGLSRCLGGLTSRLLSQLHGAWDGLRVFVDVETLVDSRRDGLDFNTQVLLNVVEVETVVPVDEVDGEAEMAETTRATDAVEISLGILGEIKVDDHVDGLDINASSQEIGADEVPAGTVAEIVEYSVTGMLGHLGMAVEARVAQLGDLLGQEFHAVGRVAKNDGLVDLQLGEERVEAVNL